MVWYKTNRPQQNIKKLKEITIEVKRLRILKVTEPIVQGVKAKLKISVEEDI